MKARLALFVLGLVSVSAPALAQDYYYRDRGERYVRERGPYVEYVVPGYSRREPLYEVEPSYREPRIYVVPGERRYTRDRPTYVRPERRTASVTTPRVTEPMRRAVPAEFLKQEVSYSGKEAPGTIVVDTRKRYLYLVQDGGTALRYGVGVGRDGFAWTGSHKVTAKREWPTWHPPAEMRARRPDLPVKMEGGPDNPLGARALYLGSTLYRIHGSNEPWTIGQAVSSGCFRMTNEDVEDLYERVPVGARVIVL
ncbi:L,D-transpeptidase [Terrihabitans rhizophilus]|uniref:L,D-transpeptidase n=1 Tax=Terrihabitans rhizophilus TaxID=3092662 RepID=A0ABU4RRT8_9HYPH|nr:L,D-transpeptidase [Terrihabitans sp. PJ23]MDX6806868.1 L,D-transpeptidase [Terrihabitans sp. PJ23]